MSARLDPNLMKELKEYGAVGIEKCYNCGNCTASCPLATDDYPFPRNIIRRVQLGQKDRLAQHLDPWLCYYCGNCSETCPKGAEPGETMMAARRWLTARYDWTGLARKFYTSPVWEIGSIVVVGLFIVLMFVLFAGPMETDRVALNTFAPVERIHYGDWVLAAFLSFFLLSNIYHMYVLTLRKGVDFKIPLSVYITQAWQLILHFVTQKRFSECDEDQPGFLQKKRWRNHFLLVTGYVLMFALVVGFLPWFQTDNIYPLYHPQRWLGYYATIVLLYGGADILWGRIKKSHQMHRFTHLSDWIFPILLLLTTTTGILVHTFRYLELPLPTYYMYTIHLVILTPMLVLEVPFGKWSHLAYRPFAIYFQAVKAKALEQKSAQEALAPAASD
ncbi:MAG TPA: 4Fe-4S dicluster domain-containing protein [Anaerolineales bacterium]|nr:4Fe-4S dicluster domain-containing protein [Anaerolineales bacterium]